MLKGFSVKKQKNESTLKDRGARKKLRQTLIEHVAVPAALPNRAHSVVILRRAPYGG